MGNELKHGSVGTELTQAEWEAVGTHVIDSQAEGDIIYASSSAQLSRLGKGADNTVLHLASGVPAWSATLAGLTLTTPTISSTGFANANHAHAASNSGGALTYLGTIATGVWQGTDVGVAYGGTGVSTHTQNGVLIGNGSSAIGSIDMSTKGHVLIGDGSGNPQMLAIGTDTHVLTADDGETTGVKWAAPAAAAAGSLTGSTLASGVVTTSATTVGVLNAGSITSGFGTIDVGSSSIAAGSFDASNGDLTNVGASGNDWTSASFTHRGTGNTIVQRNDSATTSETRVFDLVHLSSGNVGDGSGPAFTFRQNDDADSEQELGRISFVRAGADNTGDFHVSPIVTGGGNLALKLTSVGVLSVDLSGSGSAAQVDLFDRYDDATELQRFAYSGEGVEDVVPEVTEEQRLANRERMVEMGIIMPVPGASSGYHMRIQPLTRLLAGGIYQNRHRMDSQYDELSRRLEAIGA